MGIGIGLVMLGESISRCFSTREQAPLAPVTASVPDFTQIQHGLGLQRIQSMSLLPIQRRQIDQLRSSLVRDKKPEITQPSFITSSKKPLLSFLERPRRHSEFDISSSQRQVFRKT